MAVFAVGLALRVVGIGWGLPGTVSADEPPIHPDEHVAYVAAADLHATPGAMTFIYGGALYPRIAHVVRSGVGLVAPDARREFRWTLLGLRGLGVLAGLATALLVAWIARGVAGDGAAVAACALFLAFPNHALACHHARPDVLMTFLATAALACAYGVARGAGPVWLFGGAVAAGAATATLLSGMIGFAPLAVASLERMPRGGPRLAALAASGLRVAGGGVLGFALGSFESLQHWDAFRAGLSRAAATHPGGLPLDLLTVSAAYGFGVPAAIAGYLGLVWMVLRRRPGLPTLASHALVGFILLARVGGDMMRHLLLVAPVMAIAATAGIAWLAERSPLRVGRAALVGQVAMVLFTLQLSAGYVLPMGLAEDPRYRAGRWLAERTPEGARIGVTLSYYGDHSYQPRLPEGSGRVLVPLQLRENFDASRYLSRDLDYVVTTDFARRRASGSTAPAFFEALFRGDRFRVVEELGPAWTPLSLPHALGIRPPGDLLYVRPTFSVLARVGR